MPVRPSLSQRGAKLIADSPMPEYIREHFARMEHVDPAESDRYVGLCVAQNLLMWDVLEQHINQDRGVRPASVAYDNHTGSLALRDQIAAFGSANLWGRMIDADNIVVLSGAGAILEILFHVLADAGEGVLVPTPSYAGFWMDLETRDELNVVPVHTSSRSAFRLTTDLLESAYQGSSVPIKALLLTNPDNPTGRLMPSEDIGAIVAWARSHGLHIVINNIYALSVHSDHSFVPTTRIISDIGEDIHEVWGFSKDFAMSGLRAGVLVSGNQDVLESMSGLAYWSGVSGDTQHLLATMLADDEWTDHFVSEMRSRLRSSYTTTTSSLDAASIPYIKGDAGLFLIADLRQYMDSMTWDEEYRLWRRILEDARVNLTPGSACHIGEPGFFRICFATEPPHMVAAAIRRIASLLNA